MSIIRINSSNIFKVVPSNYVKSNLISSCEVNTTNISYNGEDTIFESPSIEIHSIDTSGSIDADYIFIGGTSSYPFKKVNQEYNSEGTLIRYGVANNSNLEFFLGDEIVGDFSYENDVSHQYISNYYLQCELQWSKGGSTNLTTESRIFKDIFKHNKTLDCLEISTGELVIPNSYYIRDIGLISIKLLVIGDTYTSYKSTQKFTKIGYENAPLDTVFVFPQNEIIQKRSYNETLASNVIKRHINGKEVFTLKCSVSNYYDTNGNLVISPNNSNYPAVFEKYDIVQPYTFTSKGEKPLSTNADGTAKRFEVIRVDFSYMGVVWQELTLQEYIE